MLDIALGLVVARKARLSTAHRKKVYPCRRQPPTQCERGLPSSTTPATTYRQTNAPCRQLQVKTGQTIPEETIRASLASTTNLIVLDVCPSSTSCYSTFLIPRALKVCQSLAIFCLLEHGTHKHSSSISEKSSPTCSWTLRHLQSMKFYNMLADRPYESGGKQRRRTLLSSSVEIALSRSQYLFFCLALPTVLIVPLHITCI